ncbi:MAG: hypothetical protein ACYDCG_19855 [Candidatus Acidiferrales bacterium]
MKISIRYLATFVLALVLGLSVTPASSRDTTATVMNHRQIVVLVYETSKGLRFDLESGIYKGAEYKKVDANYFLADLKLHEGGDCQIIEVLDDRIPLASITEISEMAINAGFKDIRPFVHWHKTGRMAELQFGPPIKFTMSADKIVQRIGKTK